MPKESLHAYLGGRVSFLRVERVRCLDVFGWRVLRAPDRTVVNLPLLSYCRLGDRFSVVVCAGLWTHQKIASRVLSESCLRLVGYSRIGREWQLACCGVRYTRSGKGWMLTAWGKNLLGHFKKG